MLSETKLDSGFPGSLFTIPGYRICCKDRNQYGGDLIFYVNEDIPCKTITTFDFPNTLEVLRLEINLRNKKNTYWLFVIGCCKPPSFNEEYLLDQLNAAFFILLDVFNISRDDERLKEFCNPFSLGQLIKTPTCYMGTNPSSIDHLITNMTSLFMNSCTVETGIYDYHRLIMSIWRLTLR